MGHLAGAGALFLAAGRGCANPLPDASIRRISSFSISFMVDAPASVLVTYVE
jgi:hypothetical protein